MISENSYVKGVYGKSNIELAKALTSISIKTSLVHVGRRWDDMVYSNMRIRRGCWPFVSRKFHHRSENVSHKV